MSPAHFSFDSSHEFSGPIPDARVSTPVHVSSTAILEVFDAAPPSAGVSIHERNALTLSAVWCAINLRANTIASMPLDLYRRTKDDSREIVKDHPVADLLADRPNPAMSWFTFTQVLQAHLDSWGRAAASIERDQLDRVIGLWPITPDRIAPDLDDEGMPIYWIDYKEYLKPEDLVWIPGLGFDGLCGYSPIRIARESLSAAAAAEKHGANFFGADGRPSGVLQLKNRVKKEVREAMREEWRSLYGGGANSGRIAILQEGAEFKAISLPPEDSQFLQTRKFSILEIARWFNIPPHKLKDLDRATFSNIDEQGQEFLTDSILPFLVLWTQELAYKLLTREERKTMYFEHNFEHILRARVKDRFAAYAVARQWGWMSVNDIRRRENMPLIGPEGDVYMVPANMLPASQFTRPKRDKGTQGLVGPDGRSLQEWLRVSI